MALLIVDPIAFRGGSKVATETLLSLLPAEGARVLTRDSDSWRAQTCRRLWLPTWLQGREQGWRYLLKQGVILLQILWQARGGVTALVGASGPGVDLAVHWAARLLGRPAVQFVHGPVGCSGVARRALARVDRLFYLESARPSLERLLGRPLPAHWHPFQNGLSQRQWPSPSSGQGMLWAASLLRWKGLDLMLDAHRQLRDPLPLHVCYLTPKETGQPVSTIDPTQPGIHWYCAPRNLDIIRAHCSVFISTSQREPFGLSLLEAMAAGLCVVLPRDGAYWDRELEEGVHCIKYEADSPDDLARVIGALSADPQQARLIGERAARLARERYRAEQTWQAPCRYLLRLMERGLA
ncbi:glycosyltransferase family 4 protein [Aeromonas diversa]|uniref:glycosyltransferase family 4 protein n=1 Tax=Aeromonas diversa TaxID=502790 RepID=UPI0034634EB6